MNTSCFTSFPSLTTDRTLLRRLVINDGTEIFKLRSDDRVNQFLGRPLTASFEEAQLFIEERNKDIDNKESFYWGIVLKNNISKIIGTICLWNFSNDRYQAEIGYELNPDFQGKGIMQEALQSVINFAFKECKLETITAYVHSQNTKSLQLLEKCNFSSNPKGPGNFISQDELQILVVCTISNTKHI